MPTTKKPEPVNSTMASRRAERLRAEAAGEVEPRKPYAPKGTLRAGINAENPVVVVTNVHA